MKWISGAAATAAGAATAVATELVPPLDVDLLVLLDLLPVVDAGAAGEHEPAHADVAEHAICKTRTDVLQGHVAFSSFKDLHFLPGKLFLLFNYGVSTRPHFSTLILV